MCVRDPHTYTNTHKQGHNEHAVLTVQEHKDWQCMSVCLYDGAGVAQEGELHGLLVTERVLVRSPDCQSVPKQGT